MEELLPSTKTISLTPSQVIEFLVTVNELCEENYPADSVEVALVFNPEKAKVHVHVAALFDLFI